MSPASTSAPPSISHAAWLTAPATQRVFQALTKKGHQARAVGGCVRNTLLAALESPPSSPRSAATDIDIATTATPDEIIELAANAGLRTVPTGLKHGTVTIISDGTSFETTTLRQDIATDGRHAEVAFTRDWAADAARRDFTMNALYADADGTIHDPLNGYGDLRARAVRFVGDPDQRIKEDYLRILRFFRFFAQYGSEEPDPVGLQACVANRAGIAGLSAERIRQELMKLLVAPRADAAITWMHQFGILAEVLPVAPQLTRFNRMLSYDTEHDAPLRLAALTVHVEENATKLSERLRLSRAETNTLALVASAAWRNANHLTNAQVARALLYRQGTERYLQIIKWMRSTALAPLAEIDWQKLMALPLNWQPPAMPITGQDLIVLGFKQGPEIGEIISAAEDEWVGSDFRLSRSTLLKTAKKHRTNAGTTLQTKA